MPRGGQRVVWSYKYSQVFETIQSDSLSFAIQLDRNLQAKGSEVVQPLLSGIFKIERHEGITDAS